MKNYSKTEVMPLIVESKKFDAMMRQLGGSYIKQGYQLFDGKKVSLVTPNFQNGETIFSIAIKGKDPKTTKKNIQSLLKRI